ncbi:MAG: SBBP repeat-containing protein [Saprospiraceae bacterium]
MNKHLTTIIALILSITTSFAQADWAKNVGGSSLDQGTDICVDNMGYIYTTGFYEGSVNFDPNGSTAGTLGSAGQRDFFIAKYDNLGDLVWVKGIGGGSNDHGRSIALDGLGNLYVAGDFDGLMDFDPGVGLNLKDVQGGSDIFIAKYDVQGQFLWAKTFGGNGVETCRDMVIDGNGDLIITGVFQGTADFDPNGGVSSMTSAGSYDAFIVKLDDMGNYIWAKSIESPNSNYINQIALDYSGNINVVGYFQGTADFDPSTGTFPLTTIGNKSIFFGKYDGQGQLVKVQMIGGSGFEEGKGIAVDLQNNIYISGDFRGVVDFDPSGNTTFLTSAGLRDVFVAKYNAQGNFLWADKIGGQGEDQASALTIDSDNEVFVAAYYNHTLRLSNDQVFNSKGNTDIVMTRYNPQGDILFATSHGGANGDATTAILATNNKELYSIGWIQGMSYFTGIPLNSAGDRDVYIARTVMEMVSSSTSAFATPDKITIFPNPSNGVFNITGENISTDALTITILDATGKVVQTQYIDELSQNYFEAYVDVSARTTTGLYFVRLASEDQVITKKLFIR